MIMANKATIIFYQTRAHGIVVNNKNNEQKTVIMSHYWEANTQKSKYFQKVYKRSGR